MDTHPSFHCYLYLLLVLFPSLIHVSQARARPHHLQVEEGNHLHKLKLSTEKTLTCLYENTTYPVGARFQPDDCTKCHCPRHGGRVNCAIEDCRYQPNCVKLKKRKGECCGTCQKIGCHHSDGKIYEPGTVVVETPCEQCHCPAGGGRTICTHPPCPRLACVDPLIPVPGQCCPTCPNGPNCWLDGAILPAGEEFHKECRTCQCPDGPLPPWLDPTKVQATCSMENC